MCIFIKQTTKTVKKAYWRTHLSALCLLALIFPLLLIQTGYGMAADCAIEPTGENYTGVRYKALLIEDELSETGWVLLFGGCGFTTNGEYQPHFVDLMIKAGWASIYDDPVCACGFPPVKETRKNFTIQIGLSDYEDSDIQDNDIGASSRAPELLPRMYSNIDSRDPTWPDKIMLEYQVDVGGALEGREIEVSLVREELTRLSQNVNYFMDPDLEGAQLCKPNSQDDIMYRHWVVTLKVPSLGIDASVDLYINADQGDKIIGSNALNFMWENPGRPDVERDRFKVVIFDPEVRTTSGAWKKATRFLIDYRSPDSHLPLNSRGELVGGYRKVYYKGRPAIEASFGYGYTDYVVDGNLNDYEVSYSTKAVIDLGEGEVAASILFDESHGVIWTNSLTNGFRDLKSLLDEAGYIVNTLSQGPITHTDLEEEDVLVIGWSSSPFSDQELTLIKQFVSAGGGLLLMGEAWSWRAANQSFPLNQVTAQFGYTINKDVVYEADPVSEHPVTHEVSRIQIVGGSSISGKGGSHIAIAPDRRPVLVAGHYGDGRFVIIGDSDIFVSIDYDADGIPVIYEYDNERLATNTFKWLSN